MIAWDPEYTLARLNLLLNFRKDLKCVHMHRLIILPNIIKPWDVLIKCISMQTDLVLNQTGGCSQLLMAKGKIGHRSKYCFCKILSRFQKSSLHFWPSHHEHQILYCCNCLNSAGLFFIKSAGPCWHFITIAIGWFEFFGVFATRKFSSFSKLLHKRCHWKKFGSCSIWYAQGMTITQS